jgi:DNA-binding transcriptional ArsR family regulator
MTTVSAPPAGGRVTSRGDALEDWIDVAKALSDETRVRLLAACRDEELCVCQLTALVALAPSTVSKHLQLLRQAGLVRSRREGRWIFYGLPPEEARSPLVKKSLGLLFGTLEASSRAREDREALERILEVPPEELCRQE